jgi:hypothetical protein
MEVRHGSTIHGRVLHVKLKINRKLILQEFLGAKVDNAMGLTGRWSVSRCYLNRSVRRDGLSRKLLRPLQNLPKIVAGGDLLKIVSSGNIKPIKK